MNYLRWLWRIVCNWSTKIRKLRRDSENKGLVIAATGTGKTYLFAFDAKAFNAKRLLFVVHNKEIAANARKTFEEIFWKQELMVSHVMVNLK